MKTDNSTGKSTEFYERGKQMFDRIQPLGHTTPAATQDCVGWFGYDTGLRLWFEADKGDDDAVPLYKESPKREWVGLTDEEVRECYAHIEGVTVSEAVILMSVVRATQAKLKEKNYD
jgi:hypothetical protein